MSIFFQSENANVPRNKTSNVTNCTQIIATSSISDKGQRDERKVPSLYMTQRDENGKDHPNVTTALLTDCRESGGYEMSILETNEKDNSVVKNGSSDALSLINHNGTKNSNDGYCNQTKKTNELHTQQELLQVDLMSKFGFKAIFYIIYLRNIINITKENNISFSISFSFDCEKAKVMPNQISKYPHLILGMAQIMGIKDTQKTSSY